MNIKNWDGIENSVMKGYILYALKEMERDVPELKLSEEQKTAFFNGLSWATSDMTAQEAYDYYTNN